MSEHFTEVLMTDPDRVPPRIIERAALVLSRGGLVAFPTETVYGLGANALDGTAVENIFIAKGRPATNPVIVHVSRLEDVQPLVAHWPTLATKLAEHFWPGPLTLVLPRSSRVPDVVTAGGPTVALRMPAHPVARALLETCRLPLAAPSANRSGEISATRAEHVLKTLTGKVELILDGGPTPGGLESTVLDISSDKPRLLRPGLVSRAELEAIAGRIENGDIGSTNEPLRSPGMLSRHYAPRTKLELGPGTGRQRVQELQRQGLRIGWLTMGPQSALADVQRALPTDAVSYAAALYDALHVLDDAGLDCLVVAAPPQTTEWQAIWDRLRRASQ